MRRVEFDLCVAEDHPSLAGHFPGNPIVPGVLLLDGIVAQLEMAIGRRVVRLQQVKFLSVLRPAERAAAECVVDGDAVVFRAFMRNAAGIALASGKLALQPDGVVA